ncbi:RNA polymerase II associated protein 2 [Chamberlinius hualienensis]
MEERGILRNCGYPLCDKKLEKLTTQKYHISTKCNKVFDLSERKYFCSNFCYKAMKYLKSQLPTCPLWLLDQEGPNRIHLLELSKDTKETVIKDVDQSYSNSDSDNSETVESEANEIEIGFKKLSLSTESASRVRAKSTVWQPPTEAVEKVLKEWISLKTIELLFTRGQCVDLIQNKRVCYSGLLNNSCATSRKTINNGRLEELNEKFKYLPDCDAESDEESMPKKINPTYEQLLNDTKNHSIDIREQMKVLRSRERYPTYDVTDTSAIRENKCDDGVYFPPLVDSQSQRALRNNIVLEKLSKASSDIVEMLGIPIHVITGEFRQLIHTFRLEANNISLRAKEWVLLSLVLLKMIAIKTKYIHKKLANESSQTIIENIAKTFKLDISYLEMTCFNFIEMALDEYPLHKSVAVESISDDLD